MSDRMREDVAAAEQAGFYATSFQGEGTDLAEGLRKIAAMVAEGATLVMRRGFREGRAVQWIGAVNAKTGEEFWIDSVFPCPPFCSVT